MLLEALLVLVVVLLAFLAARMYSRRRAQLQVHGAIRVAGAEYQLPSLVWSLFRFGDRTELSHALTHRASRTLTGTQQALDDFVTAMTPEQRALMLARYEQAEKAHKDLQVWRAQRDGLLTAAGVGAVDAFILALGTDPEWTANLVETATDGLEIGAVTSELLIGRITRHAAERLLPEDIYESVVEQVGDGIDAAFDVTTDVALEGISAVADAHIPIVTIGRAMYRAKQAAEAGIDGARITENVAWDVGARGGGVATGAAIGTAFMPVVGTFIGGLLGGWLGGSVADSGKARHLHKAQEEAAERLVDLGNQVTPGEWVGIAGRLQESVREDATALVELDSWQSHASNWYGVARHRGTEALRAALEVGTFVHEQADADLTAWRDELHDTAGPEDAYHRGAFLAVRTDLLDQMEVDLKYAERAVYSHRVVSEEREKLKLA